jgi:hypothetical protein
VLSRTKTLRASASRIISGVLCGGLFAAPLIAQTSVKSVKVMGGKDVVEVEVEATDRIIPQTQVLTGPDRLVIDFPNSRPGDQVRSQSVDRGEVKDVRVGLFQSKPPVTRVVVDLKSAQSFQVFPNGRTVMIKVVGGAVASNPAPKPLPAGNAPAAAAAPTPGLVAANYSTHTEPVHIEAIQQPPLQISYQNGMLSIHSDKATLSEVLFAIQKRTGADIAIPAGAEQEKVAADIEPAPAPEVLARLLNGSKFNFLILSAPDDSSKLDRVILSTRMDGNFVTPPPPAQNEDSDDDEPAVVRNQPDPNNNNPPQIPQPNQRPEPENQAQETANQ